MKEILREYDNGYRIRWVPQQWFYVIEKKSFLLGWTRVKGQFGREYFNKLGSAYVDLHRILNNKV